MQRETAARGGPAGWVNRRVVAYLLAGLVAVDVVVALTAGRWRAYDPSGYTERVAGCLRRAWDLVLVGGSPVSEGIDPEVLAGGRWHGRPLAHVFNLGLPGATTTDVCHAVARGVAAPPRVLVYGITASDLNDDRDAAQGPRRLMTPRDLARLARYRPDTIEWAARNYTQEQLAWLWKLHYHRNGIRLWAADHLERLWPGACPQAAAEAREGLHASAALARGHGFAPRTDIRSWRLDHFKAAGSSGPPFPFLDNYRLGGHLRYLRRLLDWGNRRGVPVVLAEMPVSEDLERLHPRPFAAFREVLADLERRGVPVLRPTRQVVGLSDAEFADLIHLNAAGCARLSAWLRRALDEAEPSGSPRPRFGGEGLGVRGLDGEDPLTPGPSPPDYRGRGEQEGPAPPRTGTKGEREEGTP